jgi:hypothetical protein
MFNIKSFLEKHIKDIGKGVLDLENIVMILKKWTNIEFSKNDIEINNGVLNIKTTPIKKNIIFTKKEFILNDLKIYGIIDLR